MSMKKTDLEKHLAKKLDGRMKAVIPPQRFAQGSAAATKPEAKERSAAPKAVAVACRLPAELVNRLRERAAKTEGGMNAAMEQAVTQWLQSQS